MNVGQRVLLIAHLEVNYWDHAPPPIGAIGCITESLDADGDYLVLFDEYPCPVGDEPDWFIPHWALIPLDDGDKVEPVELELAIG